MKWHGDDAMRKTKPKRAVAAARELLALAIVSIALAGPVEANVTAAPFPVHGTVLSVQAPGVVIAAIDAVPGMYASQTRRYHTQATVRAGETFDAYLDPETATLDDVNEAAAYVPGLPNRLIERPLARGDSLPDYRFVTQTGRTLRFSELRGKVVLLSFVYSRCPDVTICPAISGKFSYLQHHLDPSRFQLVEMTLDPLEDSPATLAEYGKHFDADPSRWSLITGESAQIKNVLDSFSLDPLETGPGRIIHDDTLVIVKADGTIAELIPTSGWSPDDVLATADNVAGLSSNPLRRFELATVAGVIALCGGSISTGIVVLDSLVFLVGVGILGGLLVWITKRVIIDERY
jgi:protein SCO1/2